ncbi:MAG: hypothetical protein JNK48_20370 [Bryobacterales bacterium]|nr:hypothetical protein [Bryobacterales bacterium]
MPFFRFTASSSGLPAVTFHVYSSSQPTHAVVLGGSIAGLTAARILSSHFARITIVDQDQFPEDPLHRRGTPQARHTHGLLASGGQALEQMFPGLSRDLLEAGAIPADMARDIRWFQAGNCLARFASGLDGFVVGRPLLEKHVRRCVAALPNVRFLCGHRAEGLLATSDRTRITGVAIRGQELASDLVVDATGRGSQSPNWLASLGYAPPAEERLHIALAYTTRLFRHQSHHLDGDAGAVVPPTPTGKMGGVMVRQEHGRWTVTLIGHFGPHAPEDLSGFIDYAKRLPAPYIYEVVRSAEPLGDAVSARFPSSLRRRYERLVDFPEGFLVAGDAICSFNPIYGQGMSVSTLQAQVLGRCLEESPHRLAGRFFVEAAKLIDIPWSIAVGNDLRMPEAKGPRPAQVRFVNWYMQKLHRAAHADPVVAMAFHKVANLLAPPLSILAPSVVARVVRNLLSPRPPLVFNRQSRVSGSIPHSEKT